MDYFWSPNKAYGRRKEKKRKKKKRKREIKPRYGCLTFVWILVVNCMILYTNYLGMSTRVFFED